MANENETVEQVCGFFHYRLNAKGCFGSPFVSYANKHGDNDTLVVYIRKTFDEYKERVMAALKREILVERNLADAHIFTLLEKIDAMDEEIARLRAAIKPVLEVKLVDEGVRCELSTPCAVCDWWISGCEDDCSALAVFKAAKECQRIYEEKAREVVNER